MRKICLSCYERGAKKKSESEPKSEPRDITDITSFSERIL